MKKKLLLYSTFILTLVAFSLPAKLALTPEMGTNRFSQPKPVTTLVQSARETFNEKDKLPLTHEDYMHAAGISPSDYSDVDWTINAESGWNTYSTGSLTPLGRACGIEQELPCGKSGCSVEDWVCLLKWANTYTISRYGSWSNEKAFHLANNYY